MLLFCFVITSSIEVPALKVNAKAPSADDTAFLDGFITTTEGLFVTGKQELQKRRASLQAHYLSADLNKNITPKLVTGLTVNAELVEDLSDAVMRNEAVIG